MDFKDNIKQIAERVNKLKDQLQTEEATKNALIMPFLQALGYDVFNPMEIIPEYTCDIGIKKGEKIDYAIVKDGTPIVLIECKHCTENLNLHDNQLLRYFHVSKAKFGLLTNGINYKFYSDIVEVNKMDEKPFLEFNITEIKDNQIEELKKFHKSYFDIGSIIETASELKYMNELKYLLHNELNSPSADFVKYFTKQVYPNKITEKILEQFTSLVKKSAQTYITDLYTERLKTAISKEEIEKKDTAEIKEDIKIVTTGEEKDAYMIIKAILRQKVDADRLYIRDSQAYCSILLDDNNRKTICRLYFYKNKKYIATFDASKKETKIEIDSLNDIFNLSEILINSLDNLLNNE